MEAHQTNSFRCVTWNASSVVKKKMNLEALILQENPDLIAITVTWLTPDIKNWQLRGFNAIRCDRPSPSTGGGVMILIKKNVIYEKIQFTGAWSGVMDAISCKIKTNKGPLYTLSVYIPPQKKIHLDHWSEILERIPTESNSHSR